MSIFTDTTEIRKDADAIAAAIPVAAKAAASQTELLTELLAEAKLQTAALAQIGTNIKAILDTINPPIVGIEVDHGPPTKQS